jgi:tetratricopeptide (TPR) repeat protein
MLLSPPTLGLAILVAIASAQDPDVCPTDDGTFDVPALEQRLEQEPGDLDARGRLLEHYFMARFEDDAATAAHRRHVLWVIEHRPDSELAGSIYAQVEPYPDSEAHARARALWTSALEKHPENPQVIWNASQFMRFGKPGEAEALLERGQKLEPRNARWAAEMGQLRGQALQRLEPKERATQARRALDAYEKALALGTERNALLLEDLAEMALEAGEVEAAEAHARELLANLPPSDDWNHGNAIHKAHLVLGRVALQRGDVDAAKRELLEAGRTPGSPQLDSFGPNMTLARDLLLKDEKDVVLEYFAQCAKFWEMGDQNLEEWTASVKAGIVPDFGANLMY